MLPPLLHRYLVAGTGAPADASTSDVAINITVPTFESASGGASAVGVYVLANVSHNGAPFGGVLTIINFTAPDGTGTMHATASIRTLNPCGSGSQGLASVVFPILKGEGMPCLLPVLCPVNLF